LRIERQLATADKGFARELLRYFATIAATVNLTKHIEQELTH
jgi:hypothetical protein